MSNVAIFVAHSGCKHQCSFCDQHTISGQREAVRAQDVTNILQQAAAHPRHREHQIAFFGGSFTAIAPDYMKELLDATLPFREAFAGIRISTRPDAIDDAVLSFLKPYGVRAIELGAQSMDNEVLRLNRRGHTAEDVEHAAALIKKHGFELGVQMMTGLYGDTDQSAIRTAQALVALQPATVRIYPTVVLEGTQLATLYREGVFQPQSVEQAVDLCVRLIEIFEQAGVNIIRLGLHESEQVKAKQVAGAYHPALRELCLARMYRIRALALLRHYPPGAYTLSVGTRYVSQMVGQNKENLAALEAEGYRVKVAGEPALAQYQIRLHENSSGTKPL